MNPSIERALRALDEGFYDPGFFELEAALVDSGFTGVAGLVAFAKFAKEVFREACKRTAETLSAFWRAIEVLPPPEVEVALRRGYKLEVEFSSPPHGAEPEVEVYVQNPKRAAWEVFSLPAPRLAHLEGFSLYAWGWWIEARVGPPLGDQAEPGLVAHKSRAFLQVYGVRQVSRLREAVRSLAPLFGSLGLSDLEEALEGLEGLAEGKPIEARTQGPYVLVRDGSLYALRRGSVFGDLASDADFLAGREVKISTPFGVEISIKPSFVLNRLVIKGLICWEGECEPLEVLAHDGGVDPNDPNLFTHLVQTGLSFDAVFPNPSHSPKMRSLLEEINGLGWRGDLLVALRDEEFFRRVHLRALSRF